MVWKVGKKRSLARFLHLKCPTAQAAVLIVERVDTTREDGGQTMHTEVTRTTRNMKAVRMGLMVMSWAFMVLGFVLTHSA